MIFVCDLIKNIADRMFVGLNYDSDTGRLQCQNNFVHPWLILTQKSEA